MKFLLWGLIIAAVVLWVLRTKKALGHDREANKPTEQKQVPEVEDMVRCAHCGMHLPSSESMPDATGRAYCSEEHRSLGGN